MSVEEFKKTIEEKTGIAASLLTGDTVEENIAIAKAILAYKKENKDSKDNGDGEQYKALCAALDAITSTDDAEKEIANLEKELKVDAAINADDKKKDPKEDELMEQFADLARKIFGKEEK